MSNERHEGMTSVYKDCYRECPFKVGDIVLSRYQQEGTVEKIHETGQILVKHASNVFCTYDHAWMLEKKRGVVE